MSTGNFGTFFNYLPMKALVRYMSSHNMASAAVAAKSAGSDPDLKTTGTNQCVVDGVPVMSLAAQATIDLSNGSSTVAEVLGAHLDGSALAGKVVADNGQFYLLVTTEADGTPHVYWAHNSATAADDVAPTLQIPVYGQDELAIGLILYDNDALSGAFTVGTSNIQAADDTYYQLTGPSLLPDRAVWGYLS